MDNTLEERVIIHQGGQCGLEDDTLIIDIEYTMEILSIIIFC
jgi:hypothetical protein